MNLYIDLSRYLNLCWLPAHVWFECFLILSSKKKVQIHDIGLSLFYDSCAKSQYLKSFNIG